MQSEGLIFFSSNSLLCATLLYRKPQKSDIFGAASQDGALPSFLFLAEHRPGLKRSVYRPFLFFFFFYFFIIKKKEGLPSCLRSTGRGREEKERRPLFFSFFIIWWDLFKPGGHQPPAGAL